MIMRRIATLLRTTEDAALVCILGLMVMLPVIEVAVRRTGHGFALSTVMVQHGTLAVSMIGALVAAREGRLIALATGGAFSARLQSAAKIVSALFASVVSALLAVANFEFAMAEREGARMFAFGIPLWTVEMILPVGFAAVVLHLAWRSSERWSIRAIVLLSAAVATGVSMHSHLQASHPLVWAGAAIALVATVFGAPLFATLGAIALLLHWLAELPVAGLGVSHYSLVINPSLPAIPLFTLAGFLLAEGGAARRLVRVFDALLGGLRGGPAIVTAIACAFFTTFTGGSGVTILALGGLLLPILKHARYSDRDALGLVTGGGALGILFPPCLPLILYGVSANVDIHQLFLGGAVPGLLLVVLTVILGIRQQKARPERRDFDWREVGRAMSAAKWELLLPPIVLVSLFGGFASPVEAAALTALYAFVIEVLVYRDYGSARDVARVFVEAGLLVGGILLVLGVSLGLTSFLIDAEIPQHAVDWATASIHSRALFLLLLNVFLILVGAMMDIYSAIVVIVPLMTPLGAAFGIDPIHLGILFLTNLELGYLMPPVGENLFISAYRFNKPISEVYRACIPMIVIFSIGVVLVTYVPWLTTALPRMMGR
jgi:C4-dicarboxylate transporter DctM subunit